MFRVSELEKMDVKLAQTASGHNGTSNVTIDETSLWQVHKNRSSCEPLPLQQPPQLLQPQQQLLTLPASPPSTEGTSP